MEKLLGFSILLLLIVTGCAQDDDPEHNQSIVEMEQQITNFISQQSSATTNEVYTIPVVVHVIHNGESLNTGLNISIAQIESQIEVLNEDFRRTNPDAGNTPSEFQGVAADTKIEFLLTCNSIRRYSNNTSTAEFGFADWGVLVGIAPAWDATQYMNIWVCNMQGTFKGWASTPSNTNLNRDGVAINTTSFGRTGNVVAPRNKGRTATHEVGHWLDLIHIWGVSGSCLDGNEGDGVGDTPVQENSYFDICASGILDSCPQKPGNDMYMNYMDNTHDACRNLFTEGQKARMRFHFQPGEVRNTIITLESRHQISGPTPLCDSGGTYTVDNLTSGLRVEWIAEPAHLFETTTGTADQFNTSANGHGSHGNGTITATITDICTKAHTSVTYEILVGPPVNINGPISGPSTVTACNLYIYSVPDANNTTGAFDWSSPKGFTHTAGGDGYNYVQMLIETNARSGYVQVSRKNICGNSGAAFKYVRVDSQAVAGCAGGPI